MPTCPACGAVRETGVPACPNCGRIVPAPENMPLGLGIFFGIVLTFALWGVLANSFVSGGVTGSMPCDAHWPNKILYGAIIAGCFAALIGGVNAVRRGYPARALVCIIPGIAVLFPAAACGTSVFSAHC